MNDDNVSKISFQAEEEILKWEKSIFVNFKTEEKGEKKYVSEVVSTMS